MGNKQLPFKEVARIRDQIWARALIQYRDGYQPFSTREEAAEIAERNAFYDAEDLLEPSLRRFVAGKSTAAYIPLDDLLHHLDVDPVRVPNRVNSRIAAVMKKLGWTKQRRRFNKERVSAVWPVAREGRGESE